MFSFRSINGLLSRCGHKNKLMSCNRELNNSFGNASFEILKCFTFFTFNSLDEKSNFLFYFLCVLCWNIFQKYLNFLVRFGPNEEATSFELIHFVSCVQISCVPHLLFLNSLNVLIAWCKMNFFLRNHVNRRGDNKI